MTVYIFWFKKSKFQLVPRAIEGLEEDDVARSPAWSGCHATAAASRRRGLEEEGGVFLKGFLSIFWKINKLFIFKAYFDQIIYYKYV